MTDRTPAMVNQVIAEGPTRVVVDESGVATTPGSAFRNHKIEPDVIFIRDDGWSLGAPEKFQDVAERMWEDKWVVFMRKPAGSAGGWRSWPYADRPRKTALCPT